MENTPRDSDSTGVDSAEVAARLDKVAVPAATPLREALAALDAAGTGVLIVTGAEGGMLEGVITDGDLRRAVLHATPLETPCAEIATSDPVTAPPDVSPEEALHLMDHGKSFSLDHLPLIGEDGRPQGLLLRRDLVSEEQLGLSAVIMAGGFGTRLRPHTEDTPKPMLPVGDQPLMEHTIERLRKAGVQKVDVTTHYLPEKIKNHFGDGEGFGVEMQYVAEEEPLGTAGALRLLEDRTEPLLVINGDILTQVDFPSMLAFHRQQGADLTVGVRQYDFEVPYGVVEGAGAQVKGIHEKPVHEFLVNAGIYLLEPPVRQYIPEGQYFDMTALIEALIEDERPVVSFPIREYWLDIGQPADYEQAQQDVKQGAYGEKAATP